MSLPRKSSRTKREPTSTPAKIKASNKKTQQPTSTKPKTSEKKQTPKKKSPRTNASQKKGGYVTTPAKTKRKASDKKTSPKQSETSKKPKTSRKKPKIAEDNEEIDLAPLSQIQNRMFALLGTHEPHIRTRMIGNRLLGRPCWPTREAWQIFNMHHNKNNTGVMSANLASPFTQFSLEQQDLVGLISKEERSLGFRFEVFMETSDKIENVMGSWLFQLVMMASDEMCYDGLKVRNTLGHGFFTLSLPNTPIDIPAYYRDADDQAWLFLYRSSAPWLPKVFDFHPYQKKNHPESHDVILVSMKLLNKDQIQELKSAKTEKQAMDLRLKLLQELEESGTYHVSTIQVPQQAAKKANSEKKVEAKQTEEKKAKKTEVAKNQSSKKKPVKVAKKPSPKKKVKEAVAKEPSSKKDNDQKKASDRVTRSGARSKSS